LASHYLTLRRYADAEPLYRRSLAIRQRAFGSDHPYVAVTQNNLAGLYLDRGDYKEALPLVRIASLNGFQQKDVYLAALAGAAHKFTVAKIDAVNESYEVIQRVIASSASKAISQLSVRFAVGNDRLAQLVRKDQDLSAENDSLDKALIESVSQEMSSQRYLKFSATSFPN
jgi:tetratricopeptide (TPR) repeat protein